MADRIISDERLREIVADEDDYAEARSMAAELLAARQKIRADAEHLPTIESLTRDLYETEQELAVARAEVERATRALLAGGYTDRGGQDWKPPIGPSASRLLDELDDVRQENERLRALAQITHDDLARGEAEVRAGEWVTIDSLRKEVSELDALRAEVERLRGMVDDIEVESGHCHFLDDAEHEPPHLPDHVRAIVQERDAARAQLHADDQRAWEALGRPEGTYETTNVQRLCAEVDRLRTRVRWLDHLDTPEGRAMHATEAVRVENEQLRADLREAVTTLRTLRLGVATSMPGYGTYEDWDEPCEADFQNLRQRMDEAAKLLAKHKETNQ